MLHALLAALVLTGATPIPDTAVNALARSLSETDVARAYAAMYADTPPAQRRSFVQMPSSHMPPNDPLVHYVGRRPDGSIEVWLSLDVRNETSDASSKAFNEAMMAAMIRIGVETGAAGEAWKARFAGTSDPVLLSHAIARAVASKNEAHEAAARADLAWAHDNLRTGMTRSEVYAALRSRGLIGYNNAYNPGRQIGEGACRYDLPRDAAAFPPPGQPLPQTPCIEPHNSLSAHQIAHPDVDLEYAVGSNMACGTWVYQHLSFDDRDRLQAIREGSHPVCL
jgi:hypothetical protein